MTDRQKRFMFLFRACGYGACGAAGALTIVEHSGLVPAGFALGVLAAFMAVAEVMIKKHAREQLEHEAMMERFRYRVGAMIEAKPGIKPKPPGVEYIREGSDPVERP